MVVDANVIAFLGYCGLVVLWALLPLVPAWLTYRITPNQSLGLTGPLQGVTVRATGAFAAYLIIFILLGVTIERGNNLLGNITTAMWTVKANVVVVDKNGNPAAQTKSLSTLSVTFKPDLHRIGQGNVTLKLPGESDKWPLLLLQIPSYGGTEIDLTSRTHRTTTDGYRKIIELKDPIVIREFPEALGIGASGQ